MVNPKTLWAVFLRSVFRLWNYRNIKNNRQKVQVHENESKKVNFSCAAVLIQTFDIELYKYTLKRNQIWITKIKEIEIYGL